MEINNRYDESDVNAAKSSKGRDNYLYTIKTYPQHNCPPRENLPRHVPRSRPVQTYREVDKPTGRQSTETRTEQSTTSTKILPKPHRERTTMMSTGWSQMWTLDNKFGVMRNLPVNSTYRWHPTERDITWITPWWLGRAPVHMKLVGIAIVEKLRH